MDECRFDAVGVEELVTDGPTRVALTPAAADLLRTVVGRHGPVMFHQSGGCCDGSAPMCYPVGDFLTGDADVLLGTLSVPGLDPIDAVAFSAAVTAVHNHVLRRLLRGTDDIPESVLTDAYDRLMHRFGVHPDGEDTRGDDVVVATFPRRMPTAEVARRLRDAL